MFFKKMPWGKKFANNLSLIGGMAFNRFPRRVIRPHTNTGVAAATVGREAATAAARAAIEALRGGAAPNEAAQEGAQEGAERAEMRGNQIQGLQPGESINVAPARELVVPIQSRRSALTGPEWVDANLGDEIVAPVPRRLLQILDARRRAPRAAPVPRRPQRVAPVRRRLGPEWVSDKLARRGLGGDLVIPVRKRRRPRAAAAPERDDAAIAAPGRRHPQALIWDNDNERFDLDNERLRNERINENERIRLLMRTPAEIWDGPRVPPNENDPPAYLREQREAENYADIARAISLNPDNNEIDLLNQVRDQRKDSYRRHPELLNK